MSTVEDALAAIGEYNRAVGSLQKNVDAKVRKVDPDELLHYCETHGWVHYGPEFQTFIVLRYSVAGIPVYIPKDGNVTDMKNALIVIRSTTKID